MTAYLGLQDPAYNRLLKQSEQSQQLAVTNYQLETAAPSQAIAEQRMQLSNNLRYLSVSTCDSIYNLQTNHARQRICNMAADTCKVLHTTWYKEHWVPYTAAKTTA